ncbi:hypothetical protein MiTe_02379 [Microcystis aeruginosa NIES-2520]|uniref:Uncharacterized protein n=1 Tax=Microcystis aeruginosa NIES-2520 TaxID=2303982 RepID=A0A5A5RKW3_MICAE|nr:hypothetical protein MiTe_02379 [Microcystis aeruginosa NIES-2520]
MFSGLAAMTVIAQQILGHDSTSFILVNFSGPAHDS